MIPLPTQARSKDRLRFKRRLIAWLGLLALAVNLFGWVPTEAADRSLVPPSSVIALYADIMSGRDLCLQDEADGKQKRDDGHHDRICPACFPMGNAATGILGADDVCLPGPHAAVIGRQGPAADGLALSSFSPHRYRARAPPSQV